MIDDGRREGAFPTQRGRSRCEASGRPPRFTVVPRSRFIASSLHLTVVSQTPTILRLKTPAPEVDAYQEAVMLGARTGALRAARCPRIGLEPFSIDAWMNNDSGARSKSPRYVIITSGA